MFEGLFDRHGGSFPCKPHSDRESETRNGPSTYDFACRVPLWLLQRTCPTYRFWAMSLDKPGRGRKSTIDQDMLENTRSEMNKTSNDIDRSCPCPWPVMNDLPSGRCTKGASGGSRVGRDYI